VSAAGRGGRALERAAIGAVGLALLLVATHQLVAIDLWWQLASGAWIVEHGLPLTDPFSFGFPDRPWIEQRWLFFVAEHAVVQGFGLNGLIVAKLVWLAGCFVLLDRAMRPAPACTRALGLLVAVLLLHSRLKVRPELVSYATVIGFLWVYQRHRVTGRDRWLLVLPAIQLIWSNTHTLWIVGPALAWSAWAVEWVLARWPQSAEVARVEPALAPARRRALMRAALAVSIASLITPYLLLGQLYPATILEQIGVGSKLREVIIELRSPLAFADDAVFFGTYLFALAISLFAMLLPVRPPAFRIVAWAGFVGFSFLASRNVALLGPVAGWVVALQLGDWWRAREPQRNARWAALPRCALIATLVAAAGLSAAAVSDRLWHSRGWHQRFGFGLRDAHYPIEAMAFVDEHALPRPVLSSLGDASYLIYEGGAGSVYIDGRLEVYGADAILQNSMDWADAAGVMADADRLGIDAVLLRFPLMGGAIRGFEVSPDWVAVYYDSARVLYVRSTPTHRARLHELSLDWGELRRPRATVPEGLAPADWAEGWAPRVSDSSEAQNRGRLLMQLDALDGARRAFEQAVELDPADRSSHLHLAILAELRGDEAAVREHVVHADSGALAGREAQEVLSELARRAGDDDRHFEHALAAARAGSRRHSVVVALVELGRSEERRASALAAIADLLEGATDDQRMRLRAALDDLGRLGAAR